MIFQLILEEETGCSSRLIGCGQGGAAALVGPASNQADEYLGLALRKGLTMTRIVETDIHAGHVSGNKAVAGRGRG